MNTRNSNRRYSDSSWRYAVVPAAIWGAVIVAAAVGGLLAPADSQFDAQQAAADKHAAPTSAEPPKSAAAR